MHFQLMNISTDTLLQNASWYIIISTSMTTVNNMLILQNFPRLRTNWLNFVIIIKYSLTSETVFKIVS